MNYLFFNTKKQKIEHQRNLVFLLVYKPFSWI